MKLIDLKRKQVEDIEARLEEYDEKYTKQDLEAVFQIGIVDDNNHLIGGLDACVTTFKILYVSSIFVEEKYRRQGYGRQMMDRVLKDIKEAGYSEVVLWVFRDNLRARAFYEATGFKLTGLSKPAFSTEAVLYSREIQ